MIDQLTLRLPELIHSIILKFSYSPSPYRELRADALGETQLQALFKDYNAQTYWASVNINDFIPAVKPKWLSLAIGYSGREMINARGAFRSASGELYNPQRQYFLSLDVNLEKIKSNKTYDKAVKEFAPKTFVLHALLPPLIAVTFCTVNFLSIVTLIWVYVSPSGKTIGSP